MLALLAPFLSSGLGGLISWLQKRKLLKDAFARSYYRWVDSIADRTTWPAELRKQVIEQRKRLEAKRVAGQEVPKG